MNIIDNKKKFKDTLESYANNIFKYKLSNKPNKFNTSSNDLKKEYKKLTKLRKDINDLIENDPNDARLAYINLSTPLMHETIEKYEEVLVENGEPIMEQPKESENPAQSSAQPVLNDAEAIRASKKEQRRLMKEKKNKMKLQAKLAQQEAFNNKQIMITEKSAKDIVIEIPTEPTTPTKSSEEPDNESLRVEAVPKVKKNEEKKKKKESNISGTVVGEKNISNTDTSLLSNSKPASSGLGLAKKIAVPKPSLQPVVNTITSSPVPPKTVEWSELATQRKLKEQEEKQKEERLKFEQVKMKKQKEDTEKYLKDKFTVPSVFMKLEVPQNTVKSFETADSNVETTSVKYTVGKDNLEMKYSNENLSRQQQITTGFKNHINQTHPELPDSLKQMFTDLHTVRNSSFKNFENPEEKPKWFDFKETQEDMDSQASNDNANANTNNNTSSHGIVITGRRQDKDNGTDEKEKTREQKGNNFEFGFSFTHGLISNIFEQCVNKDM